MVCCLCFEVGVAFGNLAAVSVSHMPMHRSFLMGVDPPLIPTHFPCSHLFSIAHSSVMP